jgi:MscS family membrane protein
MGECASRHRYDLADDQADINHRLEERGPLFRRVLLKTCARILAGIGTVLLALLLSANTAKAQDDNPLRPADTSSPRATLQGFLGTMNEIQSRMAGVIQSYAASDRLFLDADEREKQLGALSNGLKLLRYFDISEISPVLRDTVAIERVLQLDEVLDHIKLPAFDSVPDQDAVEKTSLKRWRLPGTEIDIVRIDNGPRAGEWLFSAATVERLPEFYDRVKNLPYKPGPGKDLTDAYRALSSNRTSTLYEAYSGSPVGLRIMPPRWMLSMPSWLKVRIVGVSVWQWLFYMVGLLIGLFFVYGVYRLARRLGRDREDGAGPGWHSVLTPIAIIVLTGAIGPILTKILRISGTPLIVITVAQTIVLSLAAAWLVMVAAGVISEAVIASERLRPQSLDSQLIRLGARFVGIVAAIALLMEAANELGFPAFSVLAGLGVGGLAVALAARDSLANLFGSVLIMFEKPFRVGHRIRLTGSEGVVEDVGFRSTRIRTADNSLISIPNSTIVNATVENLTLRAMFRQRLLVQVTYNTSLDQLHALSRGIEQIIEQSETAKKDNYHVRFNDFGESSLNILVIFHLMVADYKNELIQREAILLKIMDLANLLGVEFAFPTRTLYVETSASGKLDAETAVTLNAAD